MRTWPGPPEPAAFSGLAGEVVRALEPHTESDPVALLVQLLVAFGNLVGRVPYWQVESDRHYPNLFAALVGSTAKGRKGTSWGRVRHLLDRFEPEWVRTRVLSGLSSGEGLIWAVRDPITKQEPIKNQGRVISYQVVQVDPGVADKRLLALETELASPLRAIAREGNTLSALVRRCWDDGNLRSLTKNSPAVATEAHVSIIGHITSEELARLLTETEAANGFGNRFLWVCVQRSRSLPFGGNGRDIDWEPLRIGLENAAAVARRRGRFLCSRSAANLWRSVYDDLSAGRPGLLGAVLSRAEPQVMRLALIYALLDVADEIDRPHLEAALALWRYCEASARHVFGDALGDPDADLLLDALKSTPAGLSRTQIREAVFSRHKPAAEIARILGRLLEYGLVRSETVTTGGRPATLWFATCLAHSQEPEEVLP